MVKPAAPDSVRVHKVLRVPPQRVYDAWLDPVQRAAWWCASEEMKPGPCEIDARVGGKYRVAMTQGAREFASVGEFLELTPPRKIVFTWGWEHDPELARDSVVTIELFDCEVDGKPATELVLTHAGITRPMDRSEHNAGWAGCLRQLGFFFHKTVTVSL